MIGAAAAAAYRTRKRIFFIHSLMNMIMYVFLNMNESWYYSIYLLLLEVRHKRWTELIRLVIQLLLCILRLGFSVVREPR